MGTSADYRLIDRNRKHGPGRAHGYEPEACGECGHYTLVRNGTHLKCDTCGASTGGRDDTATRPPVIERL